MIFTVLSEDGGIMLAIRASEIVSVNMANSKTVHVEMRTVDRHDLKFSEAESALKTFTGLVAAMRDSDGER